MWSKSVEVLDPYEALSEGEPEVKQAKETKRSFFAHLFDWFRILLFGWVTLFGFFATYAVIWVSLGLGTEWWASISVIALTVVSEFLFIVICSK